MVKIRERKTTSPAKDKAIEQFGNEADGATPQINPNAKRDFKSIRVPFNEFEYEKLAKAAALSGRSKLNFLRHAMLKLASEEEQ
jgi:hypothetical protein